MSSPLSFWRAWPTGSPRCASRCVRVEVLVSPDAAAAALESLGAAAAFCLPRADADDCKACAVLDPAPAEDAEARAAFRLEASDAPTTAEDAASSLGLAAAPAHA